MKRRILLFASFAFLSFAQTPFGHDEIRCSADSQTADGPVKHLSGHVVIETEAILLKADQADYNDDTAEITASGHVQVKLKGKDGNAARRSPDKFKYFTVPTPPK